MLQHVTDMRMLEFLETIPRHDKGKGTLLAAAQYPIMLKLKPLIRQGASSQQKQDTSRPGVKSPALFNCNPRTHLIETESVPGHNKEEALK